MCKTDYPDGVKSCPRDGTELLGSSAEAPSPEASTAPAPTTATAGPETGPAADAGAAATAARPRPTEDGFDPLVGSVLAGRYQVVRRIGEGGMGAVYEAKHTLIGKRVAVKVLLEKLVSKSDFVARLLQEARLASSIGHENIVDVTDFGTTDDGRSFVVMEFLDGESLAELTIREAPLPIERSLRIARQAASALGAAHAKGIFHRDVKPENIYLIRRADADFVKVVDFGISKAVKPNGPDEGAEAYRLTHTGLLLGTPLYMSPEQARGEEDLDHRVDIWALGVMLYECLTGEVPFRANNYLQIISQVLTHTPLPPSQLRPELGIPDAVEAVVMRAMEKDRARRYQSMGELERDLERLLAGDQNVGLPPADEGAPPLAVSSPAAMAVRCGGDGGAGGRGGVGPHASWRAGVVGAPGGCPGHVCRGAAFAPCIRAGDRGLTTKTSGCRSPRRPRRGSRFLAPPFACPAGTCAEARAAGQLRGLRVGQTRRASVGLSRRLSG